MSDVRPTGVMRAGWMAHDGYTSHATTIDATFTNELGHEIEMHVIENESMVLVQAIGPDSEIDHHWTRLEAEMLRDLLNQLLPAH